MIKKLLRRALCAILILGILILGCVIFIISDIVSKRKKH